MREAAGQAKQPLRDVLREKSTPFAGLGCGDTSLSDNVLLDAIEAYPTLLSRPIVVTPRSVRLCRPSGEVIDLLPPQRETFTEQDRERAIDESGRRIASAPKEPTKGSSTNS